MVFCLDVIQHIYPENEIHFIQAIKRNPLHSGTVIAGAPNETARHYAPKNEQHVNLHTCQRLQKLFEEHFHMFFYLE